MNRFKTLVLREWMQHRRGWLVLVFLPPALLLLLGSGLFGRPHIDFDGGDVQGALPLAMIVFALCAGVTLVVAWGAALLQSPGLARRDTQDRSIEFWLSLPVGHAPSVAATLLAHLLLLPWAALGIGALCGVAITLPYVAQVFGFEAWFALPWSTLLPAAFAVTLRVAFGLLLATLWLAPLVLLTMAASAWLKRWGVPLVAGVLLIGGTLLERVYGNPIVWRVLNALRLEVIHAFVATGRREIRIGGDVEAMLGRLPGWLAHDALAALGALAAPGFVAALAVGALGFALLVLRRQRGA